MNNKQCLPLSNCQFAKHCRYAQPVSGLSRLYFSPERTGEHCHNYELATTAYDHHDEVMAKMGAHA